MSIAVHLCTNCEHPEQWHSTRANSYTLCNCCRREPDPTLMSAESTVIETFTLSGKPEPMSEPGTVWNAGNVHRQQLCACHRCADHYATATS